MVRSKKSLSRRHFLRGAGQIAIALPMLDAMIPTFARAQTAAQKRFVLLYYGSCNGNDRLTKPSSFGPINEALKASLRALEPVKSHMSIVSGLNLPQHFSGVVPPPGEATGAQHGKMESPMLSGMRSLPKPDKNDPTQSAQVNQFDNIYAFVRGTTSDQLAAQYLGSGSKFDSLQIRLQAAEYNNTQTAPQAISVIRNGTILNPLRPVISPLEIYGKLFSGGLPTSPGPTPSPVSQLPLKKKSVLDFVLDDASRLENSLSGEDKERLQLHFENIRSMERKLASTSSGGGSSTPSASCSFPASPGTDPAIDSYNFGGWANETLRGQVQADMLAHALHCGLTNVATWALTRSQVWLNSFHTGGSDYVGTSTGVPDIHADSHNASADIQAANHNWAVGFYARLISNLAQMDDVQGTMLDNTLITFVTAEGANAHNRSNLTYMIAGCPDRVNLGQHINGQNLHPARFLISAMQGVGMNQNTLGEVTGTIPGILK